MPDIWGIVAPTGNPFSNTSINAAATATADINVAGGHVLTVIFRLRGTVTTADMTNQKVIAYIPDGSTVIGASLQTQASGAAAVGSGDIWAYTSYDLRGVQKVRASFTNNNAGSLNGDIYYYVL